MILGVSKVSDWEPVPVFGGDVLQSASVCTRCQESSYVLHCHSTTAFLEMQHIPPRSPVPTPCSILEITIVDICPRS